MPPTDQQFAELEDRLIRLEALYRRSGAGGQTVIGQVGVFATSIAPAGWLALAGQVIARADYPELVDAIGPTWNTGGEPAGSIRLPPADRALVAAGGAHPTGAMWGSETVVLSTAQMPAHAHPLGGVDRSLDHTHTYNSPAFIGNNFGGGAQAGVGGSLSVQSGPSSVGTLDHSHAMSNTGGGAAHPNSQPSMAMLVCVYAGH